MNTDYGDPGTMHPDSRMLHEPPAKAPKITQAGLATLLSKAKVQYHHFPGTTCTVCCIRLENGYCLVGESACVSPVNFDPDIGRTLAYEKAAQQLWELEGYRLSAELAAGSLTDGQEFQ